VATRLTIDELHGSLGMFNFVEGDHFHGGRGYFLLDDRV
jgi:hypothetical protein